MKRVKKKTSGVGREKYHRFAEKWTFQTVTGMLTFPMPHFLLLLHNNK